MEHIHKVDLDKGWNCKECGLPVGDYEPAEVTKEITLR